MWGNQAVWGNQAARFSFNRSGPGLQPDTTARTSPQRTVKGSRPDLQHEMRPTVLGALRGDGGGRQGNAQVPFAHTTGSGVEKAPNLIVSQGCGTG